MGAGFKLGVWTAAFVSSLNALANGPEIRPGTALPPDFVSPETAEYEAKLDPEAKPDSAADERVDAGGVFKRRHFDDRRLFFGTGGGEGSAMGVVGIYVELAVVDRLTFGAGVGLTFWGRSEGGYLRGRPIVWGGANEHGVLHAITLQLGYTHMAYGRSVWAGVGSIVCLHAADEEPGDPCYTSTVDIQPAHFGSLQAGIEHSFLGGFSLHYEVGVMRTLTELNWTCVHARSPVACEPDQLPPNTTWILSAGLSYGIF